MKFKQHLAGLLIYYELGYIGGPELYYFCDIKFLKAWSACVPVDQVEALTIEHLRSNLGVAGTNSGF